MDTLVWPVGDAPWGTTTLVDVMEHHLGGNGANTSLALAILGTRVSLGGAVGQDEEGDMAIARLQAAGVDVSGVARLPAPTAASIVLVNPSGQRKFLHRLGASKLVFPEPLSFTLTSTEQAVHYHLASLFVLPNIRTHAPVTLANARRAGLTTSVDINWDATGRWMHDLGPCLPHVDFLFMNEEEAGMVTGKAGSAAAAKVTLERGARVSVMKLGSRGCAIYTRDSGYECPGLTVNVKDTTGAGDCFAAGFLSAWLQGATLEEAGRFANAVAAMSVEQVGAVQGVRSREETESWMRECRVPVA
jgi:sugar/nucleoside kinase (ribokinase family)